MRHVGHRRPFAISFEARADKLIDPSWFEEGDNIRVADEIVVDLMLNACGETYESLKRCAETIMLDDIPVHTLNLQGLLLTKQTVREKDIGDRLVLEQAMRILNKNPEEDQT